MPRKQTHYANDGFLSRRSFLSGAATSAICMGSLVNSAQANTLKKQQKRILQIYLQGGVSQLESWDPKPGTKYGGPFQAIQTSVPGIQISELLPHTAKRMHLLSLVRSLNTKIGDHRQGMLFMEKGRRAGEYPYLGSIASKYLTPEESKLPGYIHITTRGINDVTSAFLGAQHAQLKLEGRKSPGNLELPKDFDKSLDKTREELRLGFNSRFTKNRSQQLTDIYDSSFDSAEKLANSKELFEANASEKDLQRYGKHPFGQNCLLARTLLENGGTCVKVTHHGYDTHAENFNFHLEQLEEFDKTFCMLLDDLSDRGMLESTLIIVYSEMGRTPKINPKFGRDHWGTAWSVAMGGAGIQPGTLVGKTNDEGTKVTDREVDAGHLIHTYLQAVGLDSTQDHDIPGRTIPIGDPAAEPIQELLA